MTEKVFIHTVSSIQFSLDDVLNTLKKDMSGQGDEFVIYSQKLIKKLSNVKDPFDFRFIDISGMGFYSMNLIGDSVENVFNGLMALQCNYSINFDYFTKIIKVISDIAFNSYSIQKPLKEIKLKGLNWQDAYIRYAKSENQSHCYSFNIHGNNTTFNNKRIIYEFETTLNPSPCLLTGCIGYFNASTTVHSGFVMKMECSLGSDDNYSFFVSLDEDHPFILSQNGDLVTEEHFKSYVEHKLYKRFDSAFSLTGVGPQNMDELKTFDRNQMKDLVQLHDMVKM